MARLPGRRIGGRLLLVLAPILALTALTELSRWAHGCLAGTVRRCLLQPRRRVVLALLAIGSLYGQVRQRQAAQRSRDNVEARIGDIVEAAMDPIITIDEQQMILVSMPQPKECSHGRARP